MLRLRSCSEMILPRSKQGSANAIKVLHCKRIFYLCYNYTSLTVPLGTSTHCLTKNYNVGNVSSNCHCRLSRPPPTKATNLVAIAVTSHVQAYSKVLAYLPKKHADSTTATTQNSMRIAMRMYALSTTWILSNRGCHRCRNMQCYMLDSWPSINIQLIINMCTICNLPNLNATQSKPRGCRILLRV